jgi:hypothetical protein
MRIINHRQFTKHSRRSSRWKRWLLIGAGALGVLFVVGNVGMWLVYHNRALPNYTVGGVAVGNKTYDSLRKTLTAETLLPKAITLYKDDKTQTLRPAEVGLRVNAEKSVKALQRERPWLPVWSLFSKHIVPLRVTIDGPTFEAKANTLSASFAKAAEPNHIVFVDNSFKVADATAGYRLDVTALRQALLADVGRGETRIVVPTSVVAAPVATDLSAEVQRLQKQLTATIAFSYQGKTEKPGAADIGAWYAPSGQTMALSREAMRPYVQGAAKRMDVSPVNVDEAITAAMYAVQKDQPLTFRMISRQGTVTYTYCVAQRGLADAVLSDLRLKAAATYGDMRGWSADGRIALVYAESGCDFTLWLSAPAYMAGFGAICDAYYSCRVGPNVVVNYDRWQGATDPWNAAGGSLEDYRVMVINHETGHWFGFDHATCPGSGQLAPVMMQQSIDLGGCTFNPWPTSAELARLKQTHGLAYGRDRREELLTAGVCCSCGHCTGSGGSAQHLV